MLLELSVRDLGVIQHLRLIFGPGMTALTGETGAGKTLVVDALALLVGGKADPAMVRTGAVEAWVEARFSLDDPDEVVLARAIPANGRSRAYVDGRLATIASLAEWGARLVDLHGQHDHQSLLSPAVQRQVLDRFGEVDLDPLRTARADVARIDEHLAALGGDVRARAREIDLLRFQVAEVTSAAIVDGDEDERLEAEEGTLADAVAHQQAAVGAVALLGDDGVAGPLGEAIAALGDRVPFSQHEARLRGLAAELTDVIAEVRAAGEAIDDDPARLEAIRQRRQALADLRRKYGDDLHAVLAFADEAAGRLAELEQHDARAAALDDERIAALAVLEEAAVGVATVRRAAAPGLAAAVQEHLADLAMERAQVAIDVQGDPPSDDVSFLLAANPGSPPLPLAKIASGGELARTMLALRLVLSSGPPTLVFDEVDAGIGGAAAVAVGRSLGEISRHQQVLVVTHLPQVAAFADAHVTVVKETDGMTTVASIEALDDTGRVQELSRMLSGQPDSETARLHAEELLADATRARGGAR